MNSVGRVKEVRYDILGCILPLHELVVPESGVDFDFVFVWRVFHQEFHDWWSRISHISGDGTGLHGFVVQSVVEREIVVREQYYVYLHVLCM